MTSSDNKNGLSNNPLVVGCGILAGIATIIATIILVVTFITGRQSVPEFLKITPPATTLPVAKCQWLKENFPQTLEAVRGAFNLPTAERNFRLVYEDCGAVATGFIFDGDAEFELQVPDGGCIDSYSGTYFSEEPVENAFGGLRVYGGVVRTTGVTYRATWCQEHP